MDQWYLIPEGMAKVKKGGFAFHASVAGSYKIMTDTFTEKEICDLVEIEMFPPGIMMSMVQKNSPYRKMVTYGLRKATEVGLLHRQKLFWHARKPKCTHQIQSADLIVGIETLTSAFALLMFGFGLSISIFCFEFIHKCIVNRLKRT